MKKIADLASRPVTPSAPIRRGLDPAWTVDDARELYQIKRWGGGFFEINEQGRVVVRPHRTPPAGNRSVRGH
jgi:arginine decarboxylase-like protein